MFNNTQNVVTNLPVEIQPFYQDEYRSELIVDENGEPVLVEESNTYLDEDGTERSVSRNVMQYEPVAYVVMTSRPQHVTWEKVNQVIDKHAGARNEVVESFIELAAQTERWAFHDLFLTYLVEYERVDEYNNTEQLDPLLKTPIEFEPREYPVKPIFVESGNAAAARVTNAKYKRDVGRYAPITVDGLTFDADEKAYENITGTISNWESLLNDSQLIERGLVSDDKMIWTLHDNTQVSVDKSQLERVASALSVRAALLHVEYVQQKP